MNNTKRSRQREAILEVLMNTKSHPTADKIYAEVRKTIPNISLGTVYRNLAKLSADETIQKLDMGLPTEHFDGNPQPHYHVVCISCGRIDDIDAEPLELVNSWANERFDGEICGHSITFYGRCPQCSRLDNSGE